jgi:hypothetical protein
MDALRCSASRIRGNAGRPWRGAAFSDGRSRAADHVARAAIGAVNRPNAPSGGRVGLTASFFTRRPLTQLIAKQCLQLIEADA